MVMDRGVDRMGLSLVAWDEDFARKFGTVND